MLFFLWEYWIREWTTGKRACESELRRCNSTNSIKKKKKQTQTNKQLKMCLELDSNKWSGIRKVVNYLSGLAVKNFTREGSRIWKKKKLLKPVWFLARAFSRSKIWAKSIFRLVPPLGRYLWKAVLVSYSTSILHVFSKKIE